MNSSRKIRTGQVASTKMNKTVVVSVESRKRHPLYGKIFKRTKRYKAHDESNTCKIGDRVIIEESRPLSKEKRWRVVEILAKGEVAEVQPEEIV
ncbi:30S ribosomal protein S17 [Chloroflexota bacterium]